MIRKLIIAICLVLSFSFGFVFADTNGVWHDAADVRGTIFGSDEGYPNYVFSSVVNFTASTYMSTDFYIGGTAINSVFVNEGQTDSITSAMIVDETITAADIGTNAVGNDEMTDYPTFINITANVIRPPPGESLVIYLS